jgi:hypothetical protein
MRTTEPLAAGQRGQYAGPVDARCPDTEPSPRLSPTSPCNAARRPTNALAYADDWPPQISMLRSEAGRYGVLELDDA